MTEIDIEESWKSVLQQLGLHDAILISKNSLYPFRRVYEKSGLIYKVVQPDKDITGTRENTLYDEYNFLQQCKGIVGVLSVDDFFTTGGIDVMVSKKINGVPLDAGSTDPFRFIYIMYLVARVVIKLAFRRISHNDLILENILVGEKLTITIIDFDQATNAKPSVAILRTVFGVDIGNGVVCSSIRKLIENYSKNRPDISLRILRFFIWPLSFLVRKIFYFFLNVARQFRVRKNYTKPMVLPVLRADASKSAKKLLAAWNVAQESNASSPGEVMAYYSFNYEGYQFPGERTWESRWDLLGSVTDFGGKRVLELGCNMGLLSCYLMRNRKTAATMAVDADAAILAAAAMVSDAFDADIQFGQVDFDQKDPWEDELEAFKPDIVFALNVLNWVVDKERLLKFLGGFKEVIFEGHDSFEEEKSRLRSVGFNEIVVKGTTERGRDILLCRQ